MPDGRGGPPCGENSPNHPWEVAVQIARQVRFGIAVWAVKLTETCAIDVRGTIPANVAEQHLLLMCLCSHERPSSSRTCAAEGLVLTVHDDETHTVDIAMKDDATLNTICP